MCWIRQLAEFRNASHNLPQTFCLAAKVIALGGQILHLLGPLPALNLQSLQIPLPVPLNLPLTLSEPRRGSRVSLSLCIRLSRALVDIYWNQNFFANRWCNGDHVLSTINRKPASVLKQISGGQPA